ncbi:MAG: SDR family oxidoreductase [Kiritimatiellia bacterium]|jgi:NAD(P)-dependent dehydrogenase (short-subunit alcohol dehydrogenase family)|uniref:SDR family oxidoreductase n=1 Tax=Atribacter sp. TaxID=2847780 RepID=UPI003D96A94E
MKLPFKTNLDGKVAVVTGGGGVLCSCMAEALAACGAKVVVISRRPESSQRTADAIVAAGGVAKAHACNVLDRVGLVAVEREVRETFGPVDILVNGAGGNHPQGTTSREYLFPEDLLESTPDVKTFFDLEFKGVESVLSLNFTGTLLPSQVFGRAMAERGNGCIVNISSMNAFTPLTKIPAYSAAKAAVSNFTQWLAVHMSKVGVRVNAIAPGFFLTEQNRGLLTNPDGSYTPRANTILAHTPAGRFGDPEDLVGALLWLVNDDGAGFVTGTVIPVDGGFNAFAGV